MLYFEEESLKPLAQTPGIVSQTLNSEKNGRGVRFGFGGRWVVRGRCIFHLPNPLVQSTACEITNLLHYSTVTARFMALFTADLTLHSTSYSTNTKRNAHNRRTQHQSNTHEKDTKQQLVRKADEIRVMECACKKIKITK